MFNKEILVVLLNKINDYETQVEKDKPWIAHQG